VIFSRDRGSGRHAAGESRSGKRGSAESGERPESRASNRHSRKSRDAELDDATFESDADEATSNANADSDGEDTAFDADGPYDISDAPDDVERLDLGSLQIPVLDGVGVRVQANDEGVIQQIALVTDDSALVLSVLAAPRSEAIWDEVRADIRRQLSDGGASVTDLDGEYGPEMRTQVNTPEGRIDMRFIGIDGPRWMLQATYQGRAAADPAAAGRLADCLRGVVVDRGRDAMPALEPLPLRLPREIAEQAKAHAQAQAEAQQAATNGTAVGDQVPGAGGSGNRSVG
jgi:Protein of unknown function (DUF3710)